MLPEKYFPVPSSSNSCCFIKPKGDPTDKLFLNRKQKKRFRFVRDDHISKCKLIKSRRVASFFYTLNHRPIFCLASYFLLQVFFQLPLLYITLQKRRHRQRHLTPQTVCSVTFRSATQKRNTPDPKPGSQGYQKTQRVVAR